MIREIPEYNFQYIFRSPKGGEPPAMFNETEALAAEWFHKQLPGHHVTNLARLGALAQAWGGGTCL